MPILDDDDLHLGSASAQCLTESLDSITALQLMFALLLKLSTIFSESQPSVLVT